MTKIIAITNQNIVQVVILHERILLYGIACYRPKRRQLTVKHFVLGGGERNQELLRALGGVDGDCCVYGG